MGGFGSGRPRTSDEDKKRAGTFKASRSEDAYDAKLSAKVLSGPWLDKIPEPEIPLGEFGRRKYDEYTRILFDKGRLNLFARDQAEIAARMHQQIWDAHETGKTLNASFYAQFQRALAHLRLQDDAKPIAGPRSENRFAGLGFASGNNSSVRLRPSAAADPRKR